MIKLQQNNKVVAVIVIGLLLIFAESYRRIYASGDVAKFAPDEILYDGIANAVLAGSPTVTTSEYPGYHENGNDIGHTVMPGYSYLIAAIYSVSGRNPAAVTWFQVLVSFGAVLLFFFVGQQIFGKWVALICTMGLVLFKELWVYSSQLLMESLSASLIIFSAYFLYKLFDSQKIKWLYGFGVVFGILISMNNRFVMHFAILMLVLLALSRSHRYLKFKSLVITGGIVVLILMPWHIRQYMTYDQLVVFSPARTSNVKSGADEFLKLKYLDYDDYIKSKVGRDKSDKKIAEFKKTFPESKFEKMKVDYDVESYSGNKKYLSRFLGFFEVYRFDWRFGFGGDVSTAELTPPNFTHKGLLTNIPIFICIVMSIICYRMKLQRATMAFVVFILLNMMFLYVYNSRGILLFIFPMTFIGIFYAFKNKDPFAIMLTSLLFAHILLHTYVHYLERYRVTIVPVMIMLAGFGILQLLNQPRKIQVASESE